MFSTKDAVDAMVSKGLVKAGYRFANLDDCWMANGRNGSGHLQPAANFTDMKALGDYIHDRGMLYGKRVETSVWIFIFITIAL